MEHQNENKTYAWEPQPAAARLVKQLIGDCRTRNPEIAKLADDLRTKTGTRLADWVRSIFVTDDGGLKKQLAAAGFETDQRQPEISLWQHPAGLFPEIVVGDNKGEDRQVESGTFDAALTIAADSLDDLKKSGRWQQVEPLEPSSPERIERAVLDATNRVALMVVAQRTADARDTFSVFQDRPRGESDVVSDFAATSQRIDSAAQQRGTDWACDLFFAAEREYWMSRNHAARVQHERQQQLGLGWGNHDHHTYRSSRSCFHLLVAALEQLGLECRERFYAWQESGWGAQLMENPRTWIDVLADVDLSPEEITGDFAHHPLPPRGETNADELGTVGLWCALHGESFLRAGMHHLECQFDFDEAREQLAAAGVETMAPFTDFPHLRQAFTAGQMWPVAEERLAPLVDSAKITAQQADQFRDSGALGSHLEILERNDGYKGFNQTGVSDIIGRTDPRKQTGTSSGR